MHMACMACLAKRVLPITAAQRREAGYSTRRSLHTALPTAPLHHEINKVAGEGYQCNRIAAQLPEAGIADRKAPGFMSGHLRQV